MMAETLKDHPTLYAEAKKQINTLTIHTELKLGNIVEALQYYADTSHEGAAPFGLLSLAGALLAEVKINNVSKEENIISESFESLELPSLENSKHYCIYS